MKHLMAILRAWRERRRKFRIALRFNTQHTFSPVSLWMCPTCGRVQASTSTAKFSGPQFDACCQFEAGGRIGKRFATHIH